MLVLSFCRSDYLLNFLFSLSLLMDTPHVRGSNSAHSLLYTSSILCSWWQTCLHACHGDSRLPSQHAELAEYFIVLNESTFRSCVALVIQTLMLCSRNIVPGPFDYMYEYAEHGWQWQCRPLCPGRPILRSNECETFAFWGSYINNPAVWHCQEWEYLYV